MNSLIPVESIAQKIYLIRGKKVMLDSDLTELYGVATFRLNEQVKRNMKRFSNDFMFQLSNKEFHFLTSQIAISKKTRGGRRYLPYVFTEQGVAMLSSVLRSKKAIYINILIMRAFVRIREFLATNKQIAEKVEKFEKKLLEHDEHLITIYKIIKEFLNKPKEEKKQIGFRP